MELNINKPFDEEQMNRLIREKIPFELRIRSVYLPIITTDCAGYLLDHLLELLRVHRYNHTKKISRTLESILKRYRKENYNIMHSDLYKGLQKVTEEFFDQLSRDMTIYRLQYSQSILKRKIELPTDKIQVVTYSLVIQSLLSKVLEMDKQFSKQMSDILKLSGVQYSTEDNGDCSTIIDTLEQLLEIILGKEHYSWNWRHALSNKETNLCMDIFITKLNQIKL